MWLYEKSVWVDTCGNTTNSRHVLLKVCIAMYGYVLCMVRYVWLCMCVCKLAYVCMYASMCMYVYLCEYTYVFVYVYVPTYVHKCIPGYINVYAWCVCMICLYDMYNISVITFCTRGITIYSNTISWISKFMKMIFLRIKFGPVYVQILKFYTLVKLSHIPHHFLLD